MHTEDPAKTTLELKGCGPGLVGKDCAGWPGKGVPGHSLKGFGLLCTLTA